MIDVHSPSDIGFSSVQAHLHASRVTTCWRDMGLHLAMDYMTILLATCCRLQPSAAGQEGIEEGKD